MNIFKKQLINFRQGLRHLLQTNILGRHLLTSHDERKENIFRAGEYLIFSWHRTINEIGQAFITLGALCGCLALYLVCNPALLTPNPKPDEFAAMLILIGLAIGALICDKIIKLIWLTLTRLFDWVLA